MTNTMANRLFEQVKSQRTQRTQRKEGRQKAVRKSSGGFLQKAKGAPVLQLRRYEAPFLPESLEALRGCSWRAGIKRALPKELRAAHGVGAALTSVCSV